MQFTSCQRIAAPRAFVFARAGEFDRFARLIETRGGVATPAPAPHERPRYEVQYRFRDALWPATVELCERVPPEALDLLVRSAVVEARVRLDFLAPAPEWTQARLTVRLVPRGMQGRLLLGSLVTVRGRVQERLDSDFAALARGAERLWRDSPGA